VHFLVAAAAAFFFLLPFLFWVAEPLDEPEAFVRPRFLPTPTPTTPADELDELEDELEERDDEEEEREELRERCDRLAFFLRFSDLASRRRRSPRASARSLSCER
jgi:hypothetical protein